MYLQAVYTASIPENLPVNSVLLRIRATDADIGISAWIQYSLQSPGSQDFSIDQDTGKHVDWLLLEQNLKPNLFLENLHKLQLLSIQYGVKCSSEMASLHRP